MLRKGSASNKATVGFEVFSKLYHMECFFPKFEVAINTNRNDEISFGRSDHIVDRLLMHEAHFIEIR
jgi:hypothetical protein